MAVKPLNELSKEVIAACIEVHRELGPGLLESAYESCLAKEFLLSFHPLSEAGARAVPLQRRICGGRFSEWICWWMAKLSWN